MAGLSFITPLAYDWKYAFSAIRSYYAIADEIILGLDADRISWANKPFLFDDQAVARFIAEIDRDKKIRIIQGNFHAQKTPMENDTAERKQLGAVCRPGNWVVQIDTDEILLNPLEFKSFMDHWMHPDATIEASWQPVYKIIGNKALVVGGRPETTPVATREPQRYRYARVTNQPICVSPLRLLHLTFCRSEEEVLQKLTNWSHTTDVDVNKCFDMWRTVNLDNYHQLKNFHAVHGPLWPHLEIMEWPPKSLDARLLDQQPAAGITPTTPPTQVVVQGRTTNGGMLISFGKR
jgi:hypothetical protein